jgi:hypothetical protein
MLTIEDIVSNMCEGQYADKHKNATSKAKIPPKLWFVDVVLQKNVSLGTQDTETGHVSQCPIFVPRGLLVLYSRDHLEANI